MEEGDVKRQLLYIFYLLLVICIAVWLLYWVDAKSKNIDYSQEYYARDIALLIDSSYCSIGDLEFTYKMNNDFNLDFENNRLYVKKSMTGGNSFYFTKNNMQQNNIPESLEQVNKIIIRNKEDGLVISNE